MIAYHASKGESDQRKIILIPTSAHGTNPATATMAGFDTKVVDGIQYGIVPILSDEFGQMKMDQVDEMIEKHGNRIAGIMVTNPNTAGIFETRFKGMCVVIGETESFLL